ncbi:unnamed protein product, partial [Choristocarpus tenellus]
EHVWTKTAASLALDTPLKSGHTTNLDTLWAGVPLVSLPGRTMSTRAGGSMLNVLGLQDSLVSSLKEYEDVAVALATNAGRLSALRSVLGEARTTQPLFDVERWTKGFQRGLQASFEVTTVY